MGRSLKREVRDLDDVRNAIGYLKEVRERESVVDSYLSPVEARPAHRNPRPPPTPRQRC